MYSVKRILVVIVFAISLYGIAGCGPTTFVTTGEEYTNPVWAPSYYAGVRYYYLPDIETYYDLSTHEFVYLDNGQWLFSRGLPSLYSSYNLYGGFVITLNRSVYQPWMYHQYYLSHYPRYYYRNTYHDADFTTIRGFNENERKPIYWRQEDKNRMNNVRKDDKPEKRSNQPVRQPQNPNYYGKKIGQPVKVRSNMKETKLPNNPSNKDGKQSSNKKKDRS
ncbi:MAG TPA: hypothetical protein VET23_05160 [Chitinophagaceae bacterium]|nr:hypothetical protein [Chitinophagaceae bacterium]